MAPEIRSLGQLSDAGHRLVSLSAVDTSLPFSLLGTAPIMVFLIFSQLGFQELAPAAPSLTDSTSSTASSSFSRVVERTPSCGVLSMNAITSDAHGVASPNGCIKLNMAGKLFETTLSIPRSGGTDSTALSFRHADEALDYGVNDLTQEFSFGTKIETLSIGRCITIASDFINRNSFTAADNLEDALDLTVFKTTICSILKKLVISPSMASKLRPHSIVFKDYAEAHAIRKTGINRTRSVRPVAEEPREFLGKASHDPDLTELYPSLRLDDTHKGTHSHRDPSFVHHTIHLQELHHLRYFPLQQTSGIQSFVSPLSPFPCDIEDTLFPLYSYSLDHCSGGQHIPSGSMQPAIARLMIRGQTLVYHWLGQRNQSPSLKIYHSSSAHNLAFARGSNIAVMSFSDDNEDGRDLRKPFLQTESWYRMGSRQSSIVGSSTPVIRDGSVSVLFCVLIITLGPIQVGFTCGYPFPTQGSMVSDRKFSVSEFSLLEYLSNVGPMVGAISSGQMLEYIGSLGSIMDAATPDIIGWLAISFAIDSFFLFIARILEAFGVGIISYVVPVYIAELITLNHMTIFNVEDLEKLPVGTTLPALEQGQTLLITTSSRGLPSAPMRINYVRITVPEVTRNMKKVGHSLYLAFPHISPVAAVRQ